MFLPSTSAVGASGFSLREASLFIAAIGLSMLVAGPVIRLPLQSWANYAAYLGQTVCFVAAVWFVLVFPADWSVQSGNQPVIVLYALGLGIITVGGVIGPLLSGVTREDLEASEGRAAALESELATVTQERDRLEDELDEARSETDAGTAAQADLQAELDAVRTSSARFELYEDNASEWRWRLRHRNGNVIADSGEGYTRKHNAQKGMASVRRNALGATTLLFESEPELPDEEDTFEPVEEQESQATIELYEDNAGEFRWRLRSGNDQILADSGEGYDSRSGAEDAVDRVRDHAPAADVLEIGRAAFEIYEDNAGDHRWRLRHRNGNILLDSGQGYADRSGARDGIESIKRNAPNADTDA